TLPLRSMISEPLGRSCFLMVLRPTSFAQLPVMPVPTAPKVLLTFVPRFVMIAMQATRIRASMTAYSTAVGPSSLVRKRVIKVGKRDIDLTLLITHRGVSGWDATPTQG